MRGPLPGIVDSREGVRSTGNRGGGVRGWGGDVSNPLALDQPDR